MTINVKDNSHGRDKTQGESADSIWEFGRMCLLANKIMWRIIFVVK